MSFHDDSKVITNGLDLRALAEWLGLDPKWMRHVMDYSYECGCKIFPDEGGGLESFQCPIWEAWSAKLKAEKDLREATERYEKASQIRTSKK